MKKPGKYDTSGLIEDIYEPGSGGRVLKNLLGINGRREMDRVEAAEQIRALQELLAVYDIKRIVGQIGDNTEGKTCVILRGYNGVAIVWMYRDTCRDNVVKPFKIATWTKDVPARYD